MTVMVGTAPDSWGVWFANDERQVPWQRFLDEVVAAGYDTIELGPYGYLPTEAAQLGAELDQRGLSASAGFVMPDVHRDELWERTREEVIAAGELIASVGGKYLILIPNVYNDLFTGTRMGNPTLTKSDWQKLIHGTHRLAEVARAECDLELVFHPHAETPVEYEHQIERFLRDSDPTLVSLCLDLGHHAYRGGDAERFIRRHAERISYLHLKNVNPAVREQVEQESLPFARAVERDIFVEPSLGVVDFQSVKRALVDVGYEGYGIVEQDMYPTSFDRPLPIARRTREYLRGIGIG